MIVTIFLLLILYFMIYSSIFWLLIMLKYRNDIFVDPKPIKCKSISIVIPAYNEENNIKNSIDSCLKLDYPNDKIEIIVVNDGSTDNTRSVCEKYSKKGKIKLINKKNGGKALALNDAIEISKGELIACLDADSFFERNSIKNMVGYFEDNATAAVTSTMKAAEDSTFIQKIQYIEYLFSIYLRKMMSFINVLYVTPGPGSIYRKSVLEEIGGFDPNNLVEDTDIALKIQKKGYKIRNSVNSCVYTKTPEHISGLVKQRIRWYGGYLENILGKHRNIIFNRKSPNLGFFLFPTNFIWLVSMFFLTLLFIYDISNVVLGAITNFIEVQFGVIATYNQYGFNFNPLNFFFGFLIIFYVISILIIYVSFSISRERINKKFHVLIYLFIYFPLITTLWILSVFVSIKRYFIKSDSGWEKQKAT